VTNPRDQASLVEAFRKHRPTFFPSVNTLFESLINNEKFQKLDHSKLLISQGAGMAVLRSTAE